ncbi:unnamed protein product [Didymodactylos carnosus]|uniref:Uncharacterized protein n=1 Tax=Didymodactylos carnosus TaxID=1234261 RepID=A0A813VVY8_9BILA|nr:unnamed protein product [Didymodactylos carnosus]CAF0851808.1 unnamed protein product [Didymodactylos carnosus]CAF3544287.1 unnamed protein product [Didymodactylos carnosus]CAF3639402.1 unnamed protein product [Didymodactylos carnosus]
MSYTAGLLSYSYPSLISNNLSTPLEFYEPSLPYQFLSNNNTNVISSQDLFHKPIGGYQPYRMTDYAGVSSPLDIYHSPNSNSTKINQSSFSPLNDISEYSESLATASNTASSVARSIVNDPLMLRTTYQHPNRAKLEPYLGSVWEHTQDHVNVKKTGVEPHASTNMRNPQKRATEKNLSNVKAKMNKKPFETKVSHTIQANHAEPHLIHTKDSFNATQLPGSLGLQQHKSINPKHHQLNRNQTITDLPDSTETVQAWLSESQLKHGKENDENEEDVKKNDSSSPQDLDDTLKNDNDSYTKQVNKANMINSKIGDEHTSHDAEHVWSVKTDQLHTMYTNREKNKPKSINRQSVPLPRKISTNHATKSDHTSHTVRDNAVSFNMKNDSYFDSLFDGVFFRKDLPFNRNRLVQPLSTSLNKPTISKSVLKQTSQKQLKPTKYEPPSSKRINNTLITTSSWRKQVCKIHLYHVLPNSLLPFYMQNEVIYRDYLNKDTDERYREALQALRAEKKKEQSQVNETATKRMNYGNYVRNSTKDALLNNAVTPRHWTDFMDVKKGNVYELSKEEKKELYQQSKSYGERIRNRNFAIHYAEEASRLYPSTFRPSIQVNNNEIQNILESELPQRQRSKPRPSHPDTFSRTSRILKRPNSVSTTKTSRTIKTLTFENIVKNKSKQKQLKSNRSSLTSYSRNHLSDQSMLHPSDEENEGMSNFYSNKQFFRKKLYTHGSKRNTHANSNLSQMKSTKASEEEYRKMRQSCYSYSKRRR